MYKIIVDKINKNDFFKYVRKGLDKHIINVKKNIGRKYKILIDADIRNKTSEIIIAFLINSEFDNSKIFLKLE